MSRFDLLNKRDEKNQQPKPLERQLSEIGTGVFALKQIFTPSINFAGSEGIADLELAEPQALLSKDFELEWARGSC